MLAITAFFVIICPIIGIPIAIYNTNKKGAMKIGAFFIMLVYLAFLGYHFTPTAYSDLSRYYSLYLFPASNSTLSGYLFVQAGSDSFFLVQRLFFYVIAKFNNMQMLPMFTSLLIYGLGFFTLNKANSNLEQFEVSKNNNAQLIFIFIAILPFAMVINNVRNIIAFGILAVGLSRDLISKKRDLLTALIYLVAVSMHIAALAIILVRIIAYVLEVIISGRLWKLIIGIPIIGGIMYAVFETELFQTFTEKGTSYFTGGGTSSVQSWFGAVDSNPLYKINKAITFLLLISIVWFIIKTLISKNDSKFRDFFMFNLVLILFIFVWMTRSGTTWIRFMLQLMYFLPILFIFTKKYNYFKLVWCVYIGWAILWQIYNFKVQSSMSSSDFLNMLIPLRILFGGN
ncbi:EpsG family protein [Pediococcus pentosaceus]|uniref:EpsG family protein n=1 Tax=Pediococcus pentosaceus TaxID=1255 RepID=UPI001329FB07|nr:EpsG family protein [Pediococcus pentosaceus]KAF0522878.1 hypothetical protein GBP32_05120 [Pediococcus pentosaceus]